MKRKTFLKILLNGYFFTKYFVFSVNFRTVFLFGEKLLNKKHSSRLLCRPAVKQTQKTCLLVYILLLWSTHMVVIARVDG